MNQLEAEDRLTINVSDEGVDIRRPDGGGLDLSASEALMLLDILKNEEAELRRAADRASGGGRCFIVDFPAGKSQ
jgi:hypothetical protein